MPGTKISDAAGTAFAAGASFSRSAWCVTQGWNESVWLSLHGNTIARRRATNYQDRHGFGPDSNGISEGEVQIWTQGYVTPTTMRGINAALDAMGMPWRACISKRQPMLYSIGGDKQIMIPLVEGMKVTKHLTSGLEPTLTGT